MRTRKGMLFVLLVIGILLAGGLTGCDSAGTSDTDSTGTGDTTTGDTSSTASTLQPGSGSGSFTTPYSSGTLSYGWMEKDVEGNTLDIYLSSIQPASTESGDFVYFSLSPASNTLDAGTYTASEGQVTDTTCGIDYNAQATPASFTELWFLNETPVAESTLIVTKEGDTYTLSFTLQLLSTTEQQGTVTGIYTGTLPLFE